MEVLAALGQEWSVLATTDRPYALEGFLRQPWECILASPHEFHWSKLGDTCCVILADADELAEAWGCLQLGAQDVVVRGNPAALREAVLKACCRWQARLRTPALPTARLSESELAELAPTALLKLDRRGQILAFNRAAAALLQRPAQHLYGWPLAAALTRNCLQSFLSMLHHARDRSEHTLRLGLARKDDVLAVRLLARGTGGELCVALLDMSQLRPLGENGAEAGHITLWESLQDACFTVSADGTISSCNPAATKVFQAAEHQLRGLPLDRLVSPGLGTRAMLCRRPNGTCFPGLVTSTPGHRGVRAVVIRDETSSHQANLEFARVSERERRRIGQELHDDLGQQLTALAYVAAVLDKRLKAEHSSHAELSGRVTQLAQDAVTKVRGLARGLFPQTLRLHGLVPALRELSGIVASVFDVSCEFSADGEPDLEEEDATHLYRIAQEALSNAVRHSGCGQIRVDLRVNRRQIELSVADDGHGLPARPQGSGLGLRSMRQHALLLGANLEFVTRAGTQVVVQIPRAKAVRRARPGRAGVTPPSSVRRR